MSCEYCDADVDGGCRGLGSASDCLLEQLRSAQEDAASWRRVAERLEAETQELLTACDCEIRDMTHNRQTKDKQSAAYADGALRVAKGIAHRIREKSKARQ